MADKQTILIVEDEPNLAELLKEFFRAQGYQVRTAYWGEDAVKVCGQQPPHLALLDIRLPDIDGYEVARRLHASLRTKNIPLIFLTQRNDRRDRLQGLELGAVDYITKPFDLEELQLRVRNLLFRARRGTLVNPVTGLPEGAVIDERLSEILNGTDWAILLVSLRGMDRFRETYGFVAADDVLRAVGLMLSESVHQVSDEADWVGHLTAENFVVITTAARVQALRTHVQTRLGSSLAYFYSLKDRLATDDIGEHLVFNMGMLTAPPTAFSDLDALKTAILRSRSN